jgi:hypothetical protein
MIVLEQVRSEDVILNAKLEGSYHLGDLEEGDYFISRRNFDRQGVKVWTEFSWLRVRSTEEYYLSVCLSTALLLDLGRFSVS